MYITFWHKVNISEGTNTNFYKTSFLYKFLKALQGLGINFTAQKMKFSKGSLVILP